MPRVHERALEPRVVWFERLRRVREVEDALALGHLEGVVHLDDVGRLEVGEVLEGLDLVPQLGRGERRDVRGVVDGDGDAVGLEVALRAVEALGRELVVAPRAEQLRDEHVGQRRRLPLAHVAAHYRHVAP
eukprot:4940834-Pleurochrysis_carterae.AAC.4